MTESEVIRVQYEAIKKYCQGNKVLALKITSELGSQMRAYFGGRTREDVSIDELCDLIGSAASQWQEIP